MAVNLLVYRWPGDDHGRAAADVVVQRVCPRADATAITTVIESVHDGDFPAPGASALLRDLAGRPGRTVTVWLACLEGRPAGLAAAVTADTGAGPRHSIAWLVVSPVARRRGVGSALAAATLADARARDAREVWVETRSDWIAAGAFWRALGFQPPRGV